jgi:transcription antitermination protein NusB
VAANHLQVNVATFKDAMPMIGNRRKSRELALQVLFQGEFVSHTKVVDRLGYFRETFAISDDVLGYAEIILRRFEDNQANIDTQIRQKSTNWSLERMSKVDLCILRLALAEMVSPADTPHKVVINEAIELAKKYGNTESAAFINGVLDEYAKGN